MLMQLAYQGPSLYPVLELGVVSRETECPLWLQATARSPAQKGCLGLSKVIQSRLNKLRSGHFNRNRETLEGKEMQRNVPRQGDACTQEG